MKEWRCKVCGFVHKGDSPPDECPQCSSPAVEFVLGPREKLRYDGKPFDVLLLNGSNHSKHNTGLMCDIAEKELKRRKTSYRRINLVEHLMYPCWCCYSVRDNACTWPCRNQLDDVPAIQDMMVQAKGVIVFTPINWNQMTARLKIYLDRCTAIENRSLLGKKPLCMGKTVGILVNGHEDGGMKTALDVFLYFQQMGFVLAPYGLGYRTHGASHDTKMDHAFYLKDEKMHEMVKGVVGNVIETMKLGLSNKLGGIKDVCE